MFRALRSSHYAVTDLRQSLELKPSIGVGGSYRDNCGSEAPMSLGTILLIVLIIVLIGAIPSWPYSRGWGYYPSGGVGIVVVILIILLLMGRL